MGDVMFGNDVPDRREIPVRFAWAALSFGDRVEAVTILTMIEPELSKGRQGRLVFRVSAYEVAQAVAATLTYRNWYAFAWFEEDDDTAADYGKPTVVVCPSINPENMR